MTRWYLTTVAKSGVVPVTQMYNVFNNTKKSNRGAVLVKPFPCLVDQWVTQAFENNYSQL